ncbi:MAG: adenosine deaminase [Chloroflexota bacterium]|nr:MAG: adenosine deaminase [Chloroflexota bacterium]
MNLQDYAHRIPKTELHVHLEGSIRPATLIELARRNDIPIPAQTEAELADFYRYRDFAHFVDVYWTITRCLRTPEDYRLIAYEYGCSCARQNIRYAEVTFTIATNTRFTGLSWQAVLDGLNAGREQARAEFGVDWGWVFDICRDDPETQDAVVDIALAARPFGVVGLGLGGSEAKFPPELFISSFERARQAGLKRLPHAGETAGPPSIWTALKQLQADRLGHGVRCIEDPKLVDHLSLLGVPLEVCPTSNVRLGVFPDYASHPLRRLWDQGLTITLGSDDPPMFGTDLSMEYQVLVDHFNFTADELERLSLNGIQASCLTGPQKAKLAAEFEAEFSRLRPEITT